MLEGLKRKNSEDSLCVLLKKYKKSYFQKNLKLTNFPENTHLKYIKNHLRRSQMIF